jgi:amino acid adenylation domain-containing protein
MTALGSQAPTITRRPADGPRRLSFPQERLFLLDQIMPGLSAYNVPTLYSVKATLDADRLQQAFDLIVARHEILRTRIALYDGTPMQEVQPPRPFELFVAEAGDDGEGKELLAELVRRPFDLEHDLLLRAGLVHLHGAEDLLLVVLHHIASDHLSSNVLFEELDEAYAALSERRDPQLPVLPVQYADFAEWQRESLDGELLEDLVAYWTEQLQGAPERLDLPTDRPRPSVQSYRGAWHEAAIPAEIVEPLRALARAHGVSLFMLLLAAFETLLHRYSAAEDIVVGVPVSGRHLEEVQPLLGCFSNTLALRTDLQGDPTFAELLARVKVTTLGALSYQELPFEKLVEVLNPERSRSHSPIFQVLFGYDTGVRRERTLAAAPLTQLPVPGWESARFDLSLVVHDLPGGSLHVHLGYSTDLFDAGRIARLVGHLTTLLDAIGHDPQQRLSELRLLTARERQQLLVDWNATARSYPKRCLHELISEQTERTPDAVAVVAAEGRCTYRELERRSNQLAHELLDMGVGRGARVGISVERGIEMMVALLGTLKSGAAYVPIDPTYPPQRQELMLADSGARVLLTQERYVGMLDPGAATVLCLDRDWTRISERSDEPPASASDPEQLAYVIYTSGSTGRPKGVEVTHRALVNFLTSMRTAPGIAQDDVLLAVTTLSFDIAALELYLPLLVGSRVVITPLEATMDGVQLADWLARSGATFMQATPTTWQLLVDAGWKGSASLKIACGGEALPRVLADQLLDRCSSLWHMYGPTETTVWSSVRRLEREAGAPPLGGPIANTSFYIHDRRRQPVPVGIPGELYIGGDGLADGYHGQPGLTAERFVEDGHGRRLYRTGDLVRWREDGALDFLGRIDQQVKLRGFRIELGEIETALAEQDEVASAVAVVREDVPGDRRLVAYIVWRDGHPSDFDQLRRRLRAKLPPFMVPSTFVSLDSLPTTPNGKLDRAALPAPDGTRPDLEHVYAAPETPVEQATAAIWSEVLGVDRVGLDDDFFDLGGHSLLAVKMLARIHDELDVDLPLRLLFEGPTVRALAAAICDQMLGDADDEELASLLAEVEAAEL